MAIKETFRPAQSDAPVPLQRDVLRPEEHKWFSRAIRALNREGVPFLVAGAFGLYHYTGFWRGTKDLDVLVLPQDREAAIEAVTGVGMRDMFDQEPYDRAWIFRTTRDGVIFDIIWRLANKADDVDQTWFDHASSGEIEGEPVRVVSAADMCWMKLFVFQRNRCDWPDIINVIRGTKGSLNWQHLLDQVGPHWRLLAALTDIFDWVCPADRPYIPDWFRKELDRRRHQDSDAAAECRNDLFDTRPWLTAPGAGYTGEH
ncbi:MAG TPA: nucleotidyltransferase family protein [Armatimonadota bacterium]|nr:nucleotidyltransferase family protein [Armatimonadota bacterium]